MLSSLYSGISGMQGFQTKLDVIGNNVANVNTHGYKKDRVIFQDMLSQNLQGATAPGDNQGGVNPRQVGLGSQIGSIDTLHTTGSPQSTGNVTDLAIEGDAYFMVQPPGVEEVVIEDAPPYLTRAGNFNFDAEGNLVTSDGNYVLGYINEIDEDGVGQPDGNDLVPLSFEDFDEGIFDEIDDLENHFDAVEAYEISQNGEINITLSNGEVYENVATIGVGRVNNPEGLSKVGNSMFETTVNSGDLEAINLVEDASGNRILSGVLEMSNVDLSEEFTEMIVAQRGFQANSSTITTADEILQELVNLKR